MDVAVLLVFLGWGFVVGGLARWAVPGPDPMPWWQTILVGVTGSVLGGVIAWVLFGKAPGLLLSFAGAVLVMLAYRRLVQRRPITGPDAQLDPRRD